jgi:hypothetical protein
VLFANYVPGSDKSSHLRAQAFRFLEVELEKLAVGIL